MRFVIIGGQLFGIGSERAEVFLVVLDNCIGNQVQGLLAQFFVAALQAEQAVTFGVGRRNVGKGQVFQAVFNNRVKLCRLVFVVFVISLGGNQVVDVGKGFVRLIACHCCGDGSGSDGAGAVSPRFFFGRNGIEGSLTVFRGVFRLRYRLGGRTGFRRGLFGGRLLGQRVAVGEDSGARFCRIRRIRAVDDVLQNLPVGVGHLFGVFV